MTSRMSIRAVCVLSAYMIALAVLHSASAQEAPKPAQPPAQGQPEVKKEIPADLTQPAAPKAEPPTGLEAIKKALNFNLYLQATNFYNPHGDDNYFHIFDHQANTVTFDIGEIVLSHDAEKGGFGGKFKMITGETAKFIHANGLGIDEDDNPAHSEPVDFTEFYAEYNAPIGNGLKIDFGKWVAFMGAEVIEAIDNPNVSRSFLFNYAEPFTHTGFRVTYPLNDKLNLGFYAVQGWDNFKDNNSAKTFGYSIAYTPCDKASFSVNFMHGPEQNDNDSHQRFMLDTVATLKPIKDVTFLLSYDNGWEESVPGIGFATWRGFSGIASWAPLPWFGIALRGEVFDDPDGARTGVEQELKEVTLTPEFKVKGVKYLDGLVIRPEYRHDWSDKASFGGRSSQDVMGVSMMYRW